MQRHEGEIKLQKFCLFGWIFLLLSWYYQWISVKIVSFSHLHLQLVDLVPDMKNKQYAQ